MREEAGVRPRSRSFCFEKLYFGARPGFLLWGQNRYLGEAEEGFEIVFFVEDVGGGA